MAAALFAFAPAIWQYAVLAEVFALNNLLVAILVLLAVLYDDEEASAARRRHLALGIALTAGLALSNHQTSRHVSAPLLLWAFWPSRTGTVTLSLVAQGLALFAAGLLPYLYLPIAAAHHAPISWGAADTWSGFWATVLRREYGTFQLAPGGLGGEIQASLTASAWAHHHYDQIGWWGLAFAAAGLYGSFRAGWEKRFGFGVVAVVPVVLSVGIIVPLANVNVELPLFREIVARFWQEPDLFLLRVVRVRGRLPGAQDDRCRARRRRLRPRALSARLHAEAADRHTSRLVRSYGAEILCAPLRTAPSSSRRGTSSRARFVTSKPSKG